MAGGDQHSRGVGGIGAVRRDAYSSDAIWIGIRRQRFARDLDAPFGIDHEETHFLLRTICELLSVLLERGPDCGAIAGKAEIVRRICEPVEMQLNERVRAVPEHGLDQEEFVRLARNEGICCAMRRTGKERCLEQTFAVLVCRLGVNDDAAAGAHGSAAALQLQRANGHVEDRLPRRKEADGARVHAARRVFERGEQLHRTHLGRARYGSRRKERAKNLVNAHLGPQLRTHRRSHLPERSVTLHIEQPVRMHRTGSRHAAQVVAQQVDNHHIFTAIFRVVAQPLGNLAVLARSAPATRGAFHRPRHNAPCRAVVFDAEK